MTAPIHELVRESDAADQSLAAVSEQEFSLTPDEAASINTFIDITTTTDEEHVQIFDRFGEAMSGKPIDIPNMLLRIFKLSFKYSAGSPVLQSMLQLRFIQLMGEFNHGHERIAEIAATLPLDHDNFQLPMRHIEITENDLSVRADSIWSFFMDICQHPNDMAKVEPKDLMEREDVDELVIMSDPANFIYVPLNIMGIMSFKETLYMESGRPGKSTEEQRYRSDLREHGILGKPTGSPEFDCIFSEIGLFAMLSQKHDLRSVPMLYPWEDFNALQKLQEAWEQRHNEPFFATNA